MKIEVAISKGDTTTEQGNLLEELAKKLLISQGYEVSQNLRFTGTEIDLLCTHKVSGREIYVECKAYKHDNKIQAGVIKQLAGTKTIDGYTEAWLISTSELGKDAKGYVKKIKEDPAHKDSLSFYTPEKLIESFNESNVIIKEELARHIIVEKFGLSKNILGNANLLITKYGNFLCIEKLSGGESKSVFVSYASNGEIVQEQQLLNNLAGLESSLSNLSFLESMGGDQGSAGKIKFSEKHLSINNEINIKFTHPNKSQIFLSDVFVYPDLEILDNKDRKHINAEKLLSDMDKFQKVMIFGDETSGKTSLAYMLQKDIFSAIDLPVYVNARTTALTSFDKINELLIKNAKQQYDGITEENIKNLKLIPVIDDVHDVKLKPKEKITFYSLIDKNYDRFFLLSSSKIQLEIIASSDAKLHLGDTKLLKIVEYGYKLRDKVIEKWLGIGNNPDMYDNDKHKKIIEIAKIIDTTVGKNFIPTYPIFVLTLLQSIEASTNRSLQGSAYSEYYNFLITQALTSSFVKVEELDFYYSLIAEISYFFFTKANNEILEEEFQLIYKNYCDKKIIDKPYSEVRNNLIRAKILKYDGIDYGFSHNYIYYFFVAKYLSDHIDSQEIRNQVLEITDRLYVTELANIIIFLIHHSKKDFILDAIIEKATKIFNEVQPATISKDEFKEINNLIEKEIKLVFEDKDIIESRKEELEIKDYLSSKEEKKPPVTKHNDEIKDLDVFGKINLSIKIMKILGQISKNYYGSLDGSVKIRTIEEVYSLGMRSLKSILNEIEEYQELLEEDICDFIQKKSKITNNETKEIARKIIFDFITMITFGFVAITANSVASKDLEVVYDRILNNDPDSDAKKLITLAAYLDFPSGLNIEYIKKLHGDFSGNYMARTIVKLLVMKHLYKFNHDHDKKQKICNIIEIGIEKQQKALTSNSRTSIRKNY